MKPLFNEGVLDAVLFETPDEVAVMIKSVHEFAAHNTELQNFVDRWAGWLATHEPMTHPQMAGPGTRAYDLAIPAKHSEDVVGSIISACIYRDNEANTLPINVALAGTMIERYWNHTSSSSH